jgi:two-component system, OmpR family, sensor kinase
MRTPSLQRTAVRSALVAFLVISTAVASFVYANMRVQLEGDLVELLEVRRATAERIVAQARGDLGVIAVRLSDIGTPASIVLPDGRDLALIPIPEDALRAAVVVPEPGVLLEVGVSRDGSQRILQRLVVLLGAGFFVTFSLALLLLRRAVAVSLRPLGLMSATARRIAAGDRDERLRPDDETTELGSLARAFDDMLDALEAAVDAARTAEQSQRKFLADVAHQLRTPMAGIRVSVELLLLQAEEAVPEERERLLGNLIRETGRVTRLVNGLLRIARLDLDTGLLVQSTDLVELCRSEVARQQDLCEVPLAFVVEHAPSAKVLLDPSQFQEALSNLLDNARRFALSAITVTLTEHADGSITLLVTDDGPGVLSEDRDRVFQRFVTFGPGSGTGLGLPISRAIARAHGGDLTITDDGFLLSLPGGPADGGRA